MIWAAALLLLWAGAQLGASGTVLLRRWRRSHNSGRTLRRANVLLIRPLAGDEPGLERRLQSTLQAISHYRAGRIRLCLALSNRQDTALPVAKNVQARAQQEGLHAEIRFTRSASPNHKAGQLASVLAGDRASIIVVVDSDIDMTGMSLVKLLHPFGNRNVGAVWWPPVQQGWQTLGDRACAAVLCGSLHSFPLLGLLDPRGLVGKAFAVRRQALKAAGGFSSLAYFLGEDMELARRLIARKYEVRMLAHPAHSAGRQQTLGQCVDRFARWLQVIRAQRRWLLLGYPVFFAPVLLMTCAAGSIVATSRSPEAAWLSLLALGLAWVHRLILSRIARRSCQQTEGSALVDVLLSETVLLAAVAKACLTRQVRWRDRKLYFDKNGRLQT